MNPALPESAAAKVSDSLSTRAGAGLNRILVIDASGWSEQLKRELSSVRSDASVQTVDGYLLAMGQVVTEPPDLVISHADDLDHTTPAGLAALKRLAPRAKLLLLVKSEQESQVSTAMSATFDVCLVGPVATEHIILACSGHSLLESQQEVPAEPAGRPLADADLFAHLLHDGQGVTDMALTVMTQRTGLGPIGWCDAKDKVPKGHTCMQVMFDDEQLGYLHTRQHVADSDLKPWASWLGRWIAMEGKLGQLKRQALTDELTGRWNRRYFDQKLTELLDRAAEQRFRLTLMIFDIDDFKVYNDRYGHAAGDEILCQCGNLMQAEVRSHDIVARIGGDEFGVIFWDAEQPRKPNSQHPMDVRLAAERFQRAVSEQRFPKLAHEAPGTLTISAGLAGFPWDGRTARELFDRADAMAIQSKQQGKNILTFGPGAKLTDITETAE